MKSGGRLWLTWEIQPRNGELARAFGAELKQYDFSSLPRIMRYALSAPLTCLAIAMRRPQTLFVQCPSLVLALLTACLRRISRSVLIIDAHNIAVENLHHPNRLVSWLHRFAVRSADLVIVSNRHLLPAIEKLGTSGVSLPDRLPAISSGAKSSAETLRVTLIATFTDDEPVEEVIRAFSRLKFSAHLSITGHRSRAGTLTRYESEQISFTGFLARADYERLLDDSDLLVDLSTLPNCLVCGAYEALALGRPIILSDSAASRETFGSACLYTENSADAILETLERFAGERNHWDEAIRAFKPVFVENWNRVFRAVASEVALLEASPTPAVEYSSHRLQPTSLSTARASQDSDERTGAESLPRPQSVGGKL